MIITTHSKQPLQIDRFKVLRLLAKGGFGLVYHVKDMQGSKEEYALKLLHNSLHIKRINDQLNVLKLLNTSELFLKTYLSKRVLDRFFILFEYAVEGDLKKLVGENPLSESMACGILMQLLDSLAFLKENTIIHGDIKAENILKKGSHFYLSDWDIIKKGPSCKAIHLQGDDDFSAPEIYEGSYHYASDIYSLGCTLYFMLSGAHIYGLSSEDDFSKKMFAHLYFTQLPHAAISKKMVYLINRMTEKDHTARATIQEIREILNSTSVYELKARENGIRDNFSTKFERYLYMAQNDVAYAQNIVGLLYEEGKLVQQDFSKAIYWYQKAAAKGILKAVFNLALAYKVAKGTQKDYKKAMELFMACADENHSRSFYNIGDMYENGLGVKRDRNAAFTFYKKAAYNGYEPAYKKLKQF
ncbi:protein kinase [bacterium]|nr:protein kinase [bacterium]